LTRKRNSLYTVHAGVRIVARPCVLDIRSPFTKRGIYGARAIRKARALNAKGVWTIPVRDRGVSRTQGERKFGASGYRRVANGDHV